MSQKRIVFTGGGTAGHVTPNIALIQFFKAAGWQVEYIGSAQGVEKTIISNENIPFHAIVSDKLRRYVSLKNCLAPFRIFIGLLQSIGLIFRLKPDIVFSKGGFVAFPVVFGAWCNRVPIIAHESDLSPGLANRLSLPFVTQLCTTFEPSEELSAHLRKIVVTGTPIRKELLHGDAKQGLAVSGFDESLPCLLVIGGSLGAESINRCVRRALADLSVKFQVIHICGKGKVDKKLEGMRNYYQIEYANESLPHLFACAAMVISRAGANSLYEILALGKAHLLIPLSAKISRGDQIQNAAFFQKQGISNVLLEENLNKDTLLAAVNKIMANKTVIEEKIKALKISSATDKIAALICEVVGKK